MSNPNNTAAPNTAAKKGLRRYTSLIAMIVLFLVFTVATLAFSAWVTVQQTQTGKELVVVTRKVVWWRNLPALRLTSKPMWTTTKKKKTCPLPRPQPANLLLAKQRKR